MRQLSFKRLYLIALSLIALTIIASQVLVQFSLKRNSQDAYLINIAGRQRMLSQKAVKHMLSIYLAHLEVSKTVSVSGNHKRLKTALDTLIETDKYLQGYIKRNSDKFNTISPLFKKLNPSRIAILEAGKVFLSERRLVIQKQAIKQLMLNEQLFLKQMDSIVYEMQIQAENRIQKLRILEYSLLFLGLFLLLLEAMFIFRPFAKVLNEKTLALHENIEELELINTELKAINQILDTYTYTVSHDLRSPINAMLGLIDLIKDEDDNQALRETYLPLLEKSLKKQRAFIDDLFEHTKSQQKELSPQSITLEPLIAEIMEQLTPENGQVKGVLEINGSADFITDPVYLQLILNNLISNAVKYKDREKEKSHVRIKI